MSEVASAGTQYHTGFSQDDPAQEALHAKHLNRSISHPRSLRERVAHYPHGSP